MLYHLIEFLKQHVDFPGMGLFRYISVRSIFSVIIALLVSLIAGKYIIARLKKNQITDTAVKTGENGKSGTPTMGGIIIILSLLVAVFLLCDLTNLYVQLLIVSTFVAAGIGLLDDLLKLRRKSEKDNKFMRFSFGSRKTRRNERESQNLRTNRSD